MKKEPLVSVIMNCYNGEKFLKEAIESVLIQTYQNFEIIFFDNASTDKSTQIALFYDKRLKYFRSEINVTLGEARNLAIEKCKGDYITFLDVDDLWYKDKLIQQIDYFENHKIGLVYSLASIINSDGLILNTPIINSNTNSSRISFGGLFENYDVILSSAMISAKALSSINGSFDNLLEYAEEYDLFMRICSKFDAVRVEKVLTSYRTHKDQVSNKQFECRIFEDEYILSKLNLLNKDIFIKQPSLINKKLGRIAWNKFLNEILKGNQFIAMRKLLPFIFYSFRYFLFFILSIFGSRFIKIIWNHYRKRKGFVVIN